MFLVLKILGLSTFIFQSAAVAAVHYNSATNAALKGFSGVFISIRQPLGIGFSTQLLQAANQSKDEVCDATMLHHRYSVGPQIFLKMVKTSFNLKTIRKLHINKILHVSGMIKGISLRNNQLLNLQNQEEEVKFLP